MAPTKLTSTSWRRLTYRSMAMNHMKVMPRHLRKGSFPAKFSHGTGAHSGTSQTQSQIPLIKLYNKLVNFIPPSKWLGLHFSSDKGATKILITSSATPVEEPNTSTIDNSTSSNSTTKTLIEQSDIRIEGNREQLGTWMKKLSRQLTSISSSLANRWPSESAVKSSEITTTTTTSTPAQAPKVTTNEAKVSRAALENRAGQLLKALAVGDDSNMSRHIQIHELCTFLKQYPQAQGFLAKSGVRQLLLLKRITRDPVVMEDIEEGLALLGYHRPPLGWGVRILSIDGGGLRGVMALEILRQLEEQTGKPVHQLFDYICGVSTGSVLAILLGTLKFSASKCEQLYKHIGTEIFQQNTIWGTGKLVLSHAYYDTEHWTKILQHHIGTAKLIETTRDPNCPKIVAVSSIVSGPRLEPFLFRNYDYPPRVVSMYRGSHQAELWEAARASAAAPGYFEEFKHGNDIHQDGGILVNNPTALAIHECKLLWPDEPLQCVISLGNGRFEPQQPPTTVTPNFTGLKNKLMKIIDSATDTEAVHTILNDLLDPMVYFRFNPYLSESISLDETRPEKITQLQKDACMYTRRNENKLVMAASTLTKSRSFFQHCKDFTSTKKLTYLG
ncbi:Calcium-independent phospholipase A2-gamma [Chamberlinius hualienensis]